MKNSIAVANFDKKITRTRTAPVIYSPFRLAERVSNDTDRDGLFAFVRRCSEQFRYYVREAIELAALGLLPG